MNERDPGDARRRISYDVRLATSADVAAIRRLNQRLEEGGATYRLPASGSLPHEARDRPCGWPMFRELLVVAEEDQIRAGLLLYHDAIRLGGTERPFCWLQLPISEGIVDRRHGRAFLVLLARVLEREPALMSLGVGSLDETYAKVLTELGWRTASVSFVFHPVHLPRVLRRLRYLRVRPRLRLGATVLFLTGIGALAAQALAAARLYQRLRLRRYDVWVEPDFGPWADQLYRDVAGQYAAAVVRDATTLNVRYPADDPRFTRLRLRRKDSGQERGWIVVISSQMRDDKYFGDLHVGTLVDGFGRPGDLPGLIAAGLEHLTRRGVDLVVANWSHDAWLGASRRSGFLSGPSNYFFFVSPGSWSLLEPECPLGAIHLTRGDCDGPGALLPPLSAPGSADAGLSHPGNRQ